MVAVGEFGRSPQRGVSTSGNQNSDDGRDHWPYCYTASSPAPASSAASSTASRDKTGVGPAREPGPPDRTAGDDLPLGRHQARTRSSTTT